MCERGRGAIANDAAHSTAVAVYCRLSEEDCDKPDASADSRSIQNQKSMLVHYALEQGWEIYNIYSDDDYAGSDRARPAFNQLLADAKQGLFQVVLCKSQSRFTREMELVEKYIHGLFPEWGIRFVGLADNADTANRGNKKARQINGLVNEWYLEDMSQNIRTVLDNKRREGDFIGSFPSYGYRKDPANKNRLVIDEEPAEVVRRIYALYLQGCGPVKIARMLNDAGVENPSAYKKRHNPAFQRGRITLTAGQWSCATVLGILKKELYTGTTVQHINEKVSYKSKRLRHVAEENRVAVQGTHEAIIPLETWNAVRAVMQERGVAQRGAGTRDVLAGKCRCALCGGLMRTQYGGSARKKYFVCAAHAANAALCAGARVQREQVAEEVLRLIRQNAAQYLDPQFLADHLKQQTLKDPPEKRLQKKQSLLIAKLEEQKQMLKTVYKDKVRGILTEAQYLEMRDDFERETQTLTQALAAISECLQTLQADKAHRSTAQELVRQYSEIKALTGPMVGELVDAIFIGKPKKQRMPPIIEIRWNF